MHLYIFKSEGLVVIRLKNTFLPDFKVLNIWAVLGSKPRSQNILYKCSFSTFNQPFYKPRPLCKNTSHNRFLSAKPEEDWIIHLQYRKEKTDCRMQSSYKNRSHVVMGNIIENCSPLYLLEYWWTLLKTIVYVLCT